LISQCLKILYCRTFQEHAKAKVKSVRNIDTAVASQGTIGDTPDETNQQEVLKVLSTKSLYYIHVARIDCVRDEKCIRMMAISQLKTDLLFCMKSTLDKHTGSRLVTVITEFSVVCVVHSTSFPLKQTNIPLSIIDMSTRVRLLF